MGAGTEGAFRLMSRFVTLLAVADICLALGDGTSGELGGSSAAGDNFAPAAAFALFLPNESFHLDDFFDIEGTEGLRDAIDGGTDALRREIGGNAMPGEIG